MRKWLWMGTFAIAISSYVGYRQIVTPPTESDPVPVTRNETTRQIPRPQHEGDAEPSDTIEPLVVDRGVPTSLVSRERNDNGPLSRVVLRTGMTQPPRPDAVPGKNLHMPYAHE